MKSNFGVCPSFVFLRIRSKNGGLHCVKSVRVRVFLVVFSWNAGKYGTEKTTSLDCHAVMI